MPGATIAATSGVRVASGPIRAASCGMLARTGLRSVGLALAGVFCLSSAAEAQPSSRRVGVVMVARLQDAVQVRWSVQPAAGTSMQRIAPSQASPLQVESNAGHLLRFNTSIRRALGSEMRAQFRLETTDGRSLLLAIHAESSRAGTEPALGTATGALVANTWSKIDPGSGRQNVTPTFLAVTKEGADSVVRMTLVAF